MLAIVIIVGAVVIDFLWLDRDRKRWGWMKSWSTFHKVLFFAGFFVVSTCIYLGLSAGFI
ncbi:hypothetical protein [Halobacillus salinus]|uniref:hypothetical protein n=1 Tax=Halobacillus salinus TaxID=192814 RepID=UPI0020CA3B2A|nr:hypothetical protein [Halobacillus salinus]